MTNRPIITTRKTWTLAFFARCCLVGSLGLTAACAECDQDSCEEECDWGHTNGESELQACYRACAEEAEACRGPKSSYGAGETGKRTGGLRTAGRRRVPGKRQAPGMAFIIAMVSAAGCVPTSAPANDGLDRRLEHAEDRLREIDETLTAVQEDAGSLRERVSELSVKLARATAAEGTVSDAATAVPGLDEVRCEDDTCHVQRSLIELLLENPERLARLARIVPVQDGGSTIGFRLGGIRRDSLIDAVGFQNGDLLTQVNGKALDSVDAMMSLAMSLKTEEKFTIELRRDEKATTLIIVFE